MPLSYEEVERIFRSSEGQSPVFKNGAGEGHTQARHHYIGNVALAARLCEAPNGTIAFFSAFSTRKDMVEAALEVLNGPAGTWAQDQLFSIASGYRRSHNGMRAIIEYRGQKEYRVRYATGSMDVRTMPVQSFTMLLDRMDERPSRLHIHTFYPALDLLQRSQVTIYAQRGGKLTWVSVI